MKSILGLAAILVSGNLALGAPLKVADDPLAKPFAKARADAIDYLKSKLRDEGDGRYTWEDATLGFVQPGGTSALVLLSLLEAGVKADDEVVVRGLKYLRTVEPKHTYVVSLQTQGSGTGRSEE